MTTRLSLLKRKFAVNFHFINTMKDFEDLNYISSLASFFKIRWSARLLWRVPHNLMVSVSWCWNLSNKCISPLRAAGTATQTWSKLHITSDLNLHTIWIRIQIYIRSDDYTHCLISFVDAWNDLIFPFQVVENNTQKSLSDHVVDRSDFVDLSSWLFIIKEKNFVVKVIMHHLAFVDITF